MAWYKDKILGIILISSALVKLAALLYLYFINPLGESVLLFPDSLSYIYPAQTLLTYGQFWETLSTVPMLLRTPGYPLFLATIEILTGNTTWAVVIFQNILMLGLLIPVYCTARQLAGRLAGRIAAALCAASMLYLSLSFAILSETPCTFFLAFFVYELILFLKKQKKSYLLIAALLLTCAIYVRPAAYYLPFPMAVLLCLLKPHHWKKILLCFVLPLGLALGAWHVRNKTTADYFGFSTVNAYNLYFWNEDFVAREKNIPIPQAHLLLQENLPEGFSSFSTKKQVDTYHQLAKPWLKAGLKYKLLHTPLWAARTLLGTNFVHTSRLLLASPSNEQDLAFRALNQTKAVQTHYLRTFAAKILLILLLLYVLGLCSAAICGLILLWQKMPSQAIMLGFYCLYFWAVGSVFFGAYARFRAPFEFVLCILAGIGINFLHRFLQTKRQRIN